MNARYWPCFGVKSRRESAARLIVVLNSGGSAMNIRYRVDLSEGAHTTRGVAQWWQARGTQDQASADPAGRRGVSDEVIASTPVGGSTVGARATACSNPPDGRRRWTLDLLAGAMVRLTEHDALSRETVRRRLAEDDLKPWRRDMWCIPQLDGSYVARMEDVLDLYAEVADPKRRWFALIERDTVDRRGARADPG